MRGEIKKFEVKLENERQERLKLSDKKSLEIAEIDTKSKIQLEAMKSERDFITRELDQAKEALRKKDKKLKELFGDSVNSPNKRSVDSPNFYSPGIKRKKRLKAEQGAIPESIDRSVLAVCVEYIKYYQTFKGAG